MPTANITITREGHDSIDASVASLSDIPQAVFDYSRHVGGGTLTAVLRPSGEKVFRMTSEWLDGEE